MDFTNIIILIGLTTGITEVLKRSFRIFRGRPELVALLIGILLAVGVKFSLNGLYTGLIVGLSSSGLWKVGQKTLKSS